MWTSLSTIGLCLCASKLNINVITTNVSIGMHLSVHINEQYVSVEITKRANLLEGGGGWHRTAVRPSHYQEYRLGGAKRFHTSTPR